MYTLSFSKRSLDISHKNAIYSHLRHYVSIRDVRYDKENYV